MNTLKLALLGFGNAGQAFAQMLLDKQEEVEQTYNHKILVTAISTRSKGTLVNPKGIDLERALKDVREMNHFSKVTPGYCSLSNFEVIESADYDAIMELTPLNIETGQPAIDHIRGAFSRGKHAITANKGPIAWAFEELKSMAEEKGVEFFYETTVMDGTPIFNLVEDTLKFCQIEEVSGILNSTTNFILEEMAKKRPYDEIMEEGRARGFVEADPAMDIEGYDAAAKTTALLNVLMRANITPDQVDREGIEHITEKDIEEAEKEGRVIKLLCRGYRENNQVKAVVKPTALPRENMLASVDSTTSIVSITTDLMGKVSVIEHAPEIEQTAYGIFSDMVRLLDRTRK
ncbi:homoserine dehydrogenase [Peptoniphilus sp. KCTC 25270]|uniref:homoserine dehydrogenase n=1 Tax=Peptoniphilus sp. KCTC 25270 TaxID=2897414 RepID=UPI001E3EEEE9|nr:homoserine dehydrogenase [Peptoniphilus sp. KCTC 25270]MCD1147495.1 homoserine dehydrogenase [Peptoniphilus sp. KCTC 25270]